MKDSKQKEKPVLPAEIESAISGLPREKQAQVVRAFMHMEQRIYSGPLPPPEDFAKYEETLSGATDRILKMAEAQSAHRIETERKVVDGEYKTSRLGQIIGAVLIATCLIIALVLGLTGHDNVAKTTLTTTILSIAAVFVIGKLPWFGDRH